ncbi:MAG TPA: PilZ domain-containing protein [Geobacteraceae bacterium]|nr:PilZ domain-containing protein [Geobacteraceae bacterium]
MEGNSHAIATRTSYKVILKATVHGRERESSFLCTSRDISTSGILIETDRELAKGDRVTFTFFLPGASQVVAEGEMVRTEEKGDGALHYGIRFVDIKEETRQAIERFVDSLSRE